MRGYGRGHDGVDEHALVEQVAGDVERLVVVADEQGNDRCGGVSNLAAHGAEILQREMCDVPEVLPALRLGDDYVKGGIGGCGGCRGDGGGEDVRAGVVAQVVGNLLVGGNEASQGGEGLGEGSHDEVHVVGHAHVVAHAASLGPEDAYAVGLVDHHGGVVLLCQLHYLVDMRHVAFHGEDGVGDDELDGVGLAALELLLEAVHVVVAVLEVVGEAEAAAFDDGGVVLLVEDDVVLSAGEGGDNAEVDAEAGGVDHGVFLAHVLGQARLELLVNLEGAVEEGGACHAGAELACGLNGGLYHLGVVGQAHIAVGTEHEDLAAVHHDFGVLLTGDGAEVGVHSCRLCLLWGIVARQLFLQYLHLCVVS